MSIDTSSFNILERLVCEQIGDPVTKVEPRILVRRRSLAPSQFSSWFLGVADRPGFPLSKLVEVDAQVDWSPFFRLDSLANQQEREVVEIDFQTYCDRQKDTHRQVVFAFSPPVPSEDGHLIYCTGDRGPLWSWGLLCRYCGTFELPTLIETKPVWRS